MRNWCSIDTEVAISFWQMESLVDEFRSEDPGVFKYLKSSSEKCKSNLVSRDELISVFKEHFR
jgi:hypothetical protein